MKDSQRLQTSVSPRRLRWAFFTVGVVLLGALGIVAALARERLDDARREREEMVASRVFDEMEREVSAFLEKENDRPPYTRLDQTNPETWAPFVVGYFSEATDTVPSHANIVVAEGPTSEHRRRMNWALLQARNEWTSSSLSERTDSAPSLENHRDDAPALPPLLRARQQTSTKKAETSTDGASSGPSPTTKKPTSDREIIESLNRAPERRKTAPKPAAPSKGSDPFSDYMQSF